MTAILDNATRIWQEEGLSVFMRKGVQFGYNNYIRPLLPKHVVSYNTVSVRASRIGDSITPWQTTDIPNYEDALVRGIRQYVQKGDTVVVVGGGWGVSTVVAAKQTGESGQVITYEGGKETAEKVVDTVHLNGVNDRISVRHAIVGQAISLRDEDGDAKTVSPTNLPNCDVLVLDCEGAEIDILNEMEIRPEHIIVETHGMYGAAMTDVREKLLNAGYDITDSMVAEERFRERCEENDIYVLYSHR